MQEACRAKNYQTEVEVLIQKFISDEIHNCFPDENIIANISENRNSNKVIAESDSLFTWTVDPLDGTLNFVAGDDRFCCGIGLIYDGKPFMGAVFLPFRMELYTGGDGRKAERHFLLDGTMQNLSTDRIISDLSKCSTHTHVNSESENIDICFENDFPKQLHLAVRRVWMWGCGLIALNSISKGTHHLMVHRVTYPYDIVPGLSILHSAGGVSSAWPSDKIKPWSLSSEFSGIVAACNEKVLNAFFDKFSNGGTK